MKAATRCVAVLFILAAPLLVPAARSSEAQKSTPPPKSAPAPQSPKPAPGTPPRTAAPRPPASHPPASHPPTHTPARPPAHPPQSRTLIYPYYFHDFDFVYRFPYGVYPYSRYPYPLYGYPVPFAMEGCTTLEGETAATGAVRLDIPQKDAAVYLDGFYVGTVGDVDDAPEPLRLPPGPHHLELRAPGFQTLIFDVNIQSGKTITYRTPMQPTS